MQTSSFFLWSRNFAKAKQICICSVHSWKIPLRSLYLHNELLLLLLFLLSNVKCSHSCLQYTDFPCLFWYVVRSTSEHNAWPWACSLFFLMHRELWGNTRKKNQKREHPALPQSMHLGSLALRGQMMSCLLSRITFLCLRLFRIFVLTPVPPQV